MANDIFITGSSGVLGFEALDHLHRQNMWSVRGVARRPLPVSRPDLPCLITDNVLSSDWMPGDATDATIVHCAGLANPRAAFSSYADLAMREIAPHVEMVESLIEKGWRGHMVYISSGGSIYGDVDILPIPETQVPRPKGYYSLQKISVENALVFLANQHDFRLTILRVSNPYGSHVPKKGQGVIPILLDAAMNGTPFTVIGSGQEMRDYLHISDFCRAIEQACTHPLRDKINTINIGSGIGTSLESLIRLITTLTGREINATRSQTPFDVKSNVLDVSLAREILDWQPQVRIHEGIQLMVDDYLALQAGKVENFSG